MERKSETDTERQTGRNKHRKKTDRQIETKSVSE